jgi:hypothetical protein
MGIFGSSGKTQNPAVGMSILAGGVGAIMSLVLWLFAYRPDTGLFGRYGKEIAAQGLVHDQLRILAAVFGGIGVVSAIVASFGGRGRWTTATGIVLGVVALSYPVLTWVADLTGGISGPL